MKILFIGNFDRLSVGEPEVAEALEQHGVSVIRLDERGLTTLRASEVVLAEKPDLLLYSKCRIGLYKDVEDFFATLKIPRVAWLFDLFIGFDREAQIKINPIFTSDLVFSTDGGHEAEWKHYGVRHELLRQGVRASETYIAAPDYPVEGAEIGFIGSIYGEYRPELVKRLSRRYGSRFHAFGKDGGIRHENLNRLVSTLKIVVGDSWPSPYYWSNRIYEMLGRGAFLIHPKVAGLDKEYRPYEHFIPYAHGDFEALFEKIDYFLDRPEERNRIRFAGLEFTKQNYTYYHRVGRFLKILKEKGICSTTRTLQPEPSVKP